MPVKDLLKHKHAIPFVFLLANFILRFLYIDAQDICIDEPFSIYHAQFSIGDIITFLKPTNNPPLFEIILHYWIKVFGITPIAVRLLPVLFSSLVVVFVYKIAELLFSKSVALMAALFYTLSTYSFYYAHDARAYSLFAFLTTASFYVFIQWLNSEKKRQYTILFVFLNTVMVYTHYFGFIVWFLQGMYVLIYSRRELLRLSSLYVTALLFYTPQIITFFQRTTESSMHGTWIEEGISIESLYNKLVLFSNMPVLAVAALCLILFYFVKLLIRKEKTISNQKVKPEALLLLWFFIPLVSMFFISYKVPVFLDRYLIFITPAYYILLGLVTFRISENRIVRLSLTTLMVFGFMLTVNLNPYKKREAKAVVEFVKQHKSAETLVIICAHDFINNFNYYYDLNLFTGIVKGDEYSKVTNELNRQFIYPVRTVKEIPVEVLNKFKRVLYVDAAADFSNPGNRIYETLKADFKETNKTHFNTIFNVYEFSRP